MLVSDAEATLCGSVVLSRCRRVVVQHRIASGLKDCTAFPGKQFCPPRSAWLSVKWE